jgi:hypothetical protein
MPAHSTASGTDLHEAKRVKEPVRAGSTANVTLSAPGASMDGVTLINGDRVLLKDQTAPAENGLYTWSGAASTLVRTLDADAAADFVGLFQVGVREGTANAGRYYVFTQTAAVTLGSTALTFAQLGGGGGSVSSVALTVPAEFSVAGSPVTSTGTLAISKATQTANTVFAGPTTGSAAAPTFRTVVPADLPVFGASGVSHSTGAVPDPGASAGSTRYLNENGTFAVPSGSGGGGSSSGGGGSGALVPLMVIGPITATQATMPFAGISQTGFRNLRLRVKVRSTNGSSGVTLGVQLNGDAGSNYSYEALADASGGLNRLSSASASSAVLGYVPASPAPAGAFCVLDIAIPLYTDAQQKSIQATSAFEQATSAGEQYNQNAGGFWRNTSAVTSLALVLSAGLFDVGSYACLYGEMDTTGVLLTPASNLLYETTLTAAAASVDTGTLSQAYRDLRITFSGRGDTAAQSTNLRMRFNGDTGANYNYQNHFASSTSSTASSASAQTSALIGDLTAASATASFNTSGEVFIPAYATSTNFREFHAGMFLASSTVQAQTHRGWWASVGPITSVQIFPTAGNFAAGTVVRVYGEPVAAGGASVGTGTRLRISANQSITTGTATLINWDTEDNDADNQHYTSAAVLTGTVTKTAASQTVTGSGPS